MDLWAEFRILDMGKRLGRFITHYRNAYFTPDKRNGQVVFSYKPLPGAEEAIYNKISDITISMKASDHLDMPECVINEVKVRLSDDEREIYDSLKRDLVVSLKGEEIDAGNAAALSGKLCQMANGAVYGEGKRVFPIHDRKLDALEDLIEAANGKPVLVAYWYKHDLERIQARLRKLHIPYSMLDSSESISRWNRGELPVALIHPASAGHGLNLQAGGATLVWFGLTWSLELFQQTNPEMTSFVFRETLMSHLLLWGNAYAQIIRNARGEVLALYPLMPNRMTVDRDSIGRLFYLYQRSSEDAPSLGKDSQVYLAPSDVLHIPGLGFDGLIGYSPIAMAKNAIGLAIATEEYGAKFFANGAAPGGVLEHPGTIKDPQKVKESWNAAYQGSTNSHRVAVLEEGMKYQPIGISPEQAQFLETRKFQINEIARIFRVPPHMLADLEKSSFSNIEQQSLEFVKYTLDPWVVRWEQAMCKTLLSPGEKQKVFIKFNVDGLLRGDYASRMSGYATARQNGWMSANDIRELENLDRIPAELGGDLYLINGAMTKLQDAGAFIGTQTTSEETQDESTST